MALTSARYYPWQDVRDTAWLKTALLYWDEVKTVVPHKDLSPYLSRDSQEFYELGVLVPKYPESWAMNIASQKVEELSRSGEWSHVVGREGQRAVVALRDTYGPGSFPTWSRELKPRLGIENWDVLDRNIATLFLTALSAIEGEYFREALVTDRPGLRALAESIQIGEPAPEALDLNDTIFPPVSATKPRSISIDEAGAEIALGLRFTTNTVQVDPETPPRKIVSFREKYKDELGNFRTKISDLADSLSGDYPSYAAFEQAITDTYRNSFEPSVSALERALRGQGIATKLGVLSVGSLASAPAIVTQTMGSVGTTIGLGAAAALAVTVQMAKSRTKTQAIRDKDPYSYVIRVRREFT
jgi:hypothetical protein